MNSVPYDGAVTQSRRRYGPICFILGLTAIKAAEYAIIGVSNPVFPIINLGFFFISAAIWLGLANFICYLRRVQFRILPVLRVYLMTSFIMAPVSLMRINDALLGEAPQPSLLGLVAKLVQVAVFLLIVFQMSRNVPPTHVRPT